MNKQILSGFLLLGAMGFFACSSYDHPDSNTLITAWSQEAISSSNTVNTTSSSAMTSSTLPASSATVSSEIMSSSSQATPIPESSIAASSAVASSSLAPSSSATMSSSSFIMTGTINNQNCAFISADSTLTCSEQVYRTIPINGQIWMAENLNVGKQINGASSSASQSDNSTIEKFCYSDDVSLCDKPAGGLYQWAEAMGLSYDCNFHACASAISTGNHQGICPNGWHMPKIADWNSLYALTGAWHIGQLLAITGGLYSSWDSKADNSLQLSIWPTGHRVTPAQYLGLGTYTWFPTPDGETGALFMTDYSIWVGTSTVDMMSGGNSKTSAESVRCIKD